MGETNNFGEYFKIVIREKGVTLGRLSVDTSIDKATLSRIANNKQKPNMKHLKKLSKALKIPLVELLRKAGFEIEDMKDESNLIINQFDPDYSETEDILQFSQMIKDGELETMVQKELNKYEQFVMTDEGKKMIHKDFNNKLQDISQSGPFLTTLKKLYEKFCSVDITTNEFILIGAALLYFILPIDIIPDFIFPIGFVDDMIAVKIILNILEVGH